MSKRKLIEVIFLPVKGLAKFSEVLNKMAEDGYVIENSSVIPAKDGGVVVYVMRDAMAGEAEEIEDEPEAEDAAEGESAEVDADTTVVHGSNGAQTLPEPTIVGASEG